MANPDNALGTNGAYGGRTSVNAFNDVLAYFNNRGILSGWKCQPNTGLTVSIGGDGVERDVAIAEDNAGNKTTVNNISQSPISVTLPAAPATNSRVDAIVVYIEGSPSASGETDNYTAVNLLTVSGTSSVNPTAPNDGDIRTAITSDGASGATAYYVVLAYITITSGTTDIDSTMIASGPTVRTDNYSLDEINTYVVFVDGKYIYKKTVFISSFPSGGETSLGNLLPSGIVNLVKIEGTATAGTGVLDVNGVRYYGSTTPSQLANGVAVRIDKATGQVLVSSNFDARSFSGYVTFYYTR